MKQIFELPSIIDRKKKRRGQGSGSGKGKTGGRGTKGQKARTKKPTTLGDQGAALLRRLPFYRGKMRNKSFQAKITVLNLSHLAMLPKGAAVTLNTVITHRLVDEAIARRGGVKILGDGTISHALTVHLPCSASAKKKIEAAGGQVTT